LKIENCKLKIISPVGYLDMLILEKNAKKILTDSGGVQKEAYWSKVPCITLMEGTGWPETVKAGWNILVGIDKEKIIEAIKKFNLKTKQYNYFGNGKSAKKIVKILTKE
jgi:UDP-N-acetylglucosamine 2-epimerase (non-hydrolysing)